MLRTSTIGPDSMVKKDPTSIRIGGLQKTSLIDFPGKVACVLFLKGCNFSCPYCHNPELVKDNGNPSLTYLEEGIYGFLEKRKGLLDGVVISGGEPTLQEGLPFACEKIKNMGFSIKLDTNGSRPGMIGRLVKEGLVDYIAMDIKTDPTDYAQVVNGRFQSSSLLTSVRIIMESSIAYEFRTTCVRFLVDDGIIRNIARTIEGAPLYALQGFNPAEILNPEFFKGKNAGFSEEAFVRMSSIAAPWVRQCIVR